jgi:AcrR family transcriptional regulator
LVLNVDVRSVNYKKPYGIKMNVSREKPTRGRPKTFDRNHVIDVAMRDYWQEGQAEVSLNSVCQRAGVSKPSLYKEFGSEDGLKKAVLIDYHKMTLAPLYKLLAVDQPFDTALEALSAYILRDHQEYGLPNGCLFVDLCQCRAQLGALTGGQVDEFRGLSIGTFAKWIERAKANGQFTSTIPTKTAARYIDAQIACIMNMQRQGAASNEVNAVFRLALSVFE